MTRATGSGPRQSRRPRRGSASQSAQVPVAQRVVRQLAQFPGGGDYTDVAAAPAAIALSTGRRDRQLRVPGGEAFAKLVRTTQDMNVRLRDVAGYVVEHAERIAAEAWRNRRGVGCVDRLEYAGGDAAT